MRLNRIVAGLLVLLISVAWTSVAQAGIFSSISTYVKEQSEIRSHSKNVASGIKELYRDRKSIQELTLASAKLIQAYREIKDKKANISLLVSIAQNINTVVQKYQSVAPKAQAVYQKISPDLDYFSKFKGDGDGETLQLGKTLVKLDSLSESRIGKLSGGAGWGRVFETIGDDPLNIFRWGKLKDEYDYGKAEAKYALKGLQIAFEATSYYKLANEHIRGLLDIQKQIQGVLGGSWDAILNLPKVVDNLQGAAQGVDDFGNVLNSAADRMGKRFEELKGYQDEFLTAHQTYTRKYNAQPVSATTPQVGTPGISPINSTSQAPAATSAQTNLKSAMDAYQKAYQLYTNTVQNPNCTVAQRDKAIKTLNDARQLYESLKSAANR